MRDKLIFVHTPKCGGSYVQSILSHFKIKSKGHVQAVPEDGITFTVIRHPVERFESLLNYRLGENEPRADWPTHLAYAYKDPTVQLDELVSSMTDEEILGFSPYKTLTYWTQNVNLVITIDNLATLLGHFDYTYDPHWFQPVNVSVKTRGKLNPQNKDRIKLLFRADVELYEKVVKFD
jgi:hypothetical protein